MLPNPTAPVATSKTSSYWRAKPCVWKLWMLANPPSNKSLLSLSRRRLSSRSCRSGGTSQGMGGGATSRGLRACACSVAQPALRKGEVRLRRPGWPKLGRRRGKTGETLPSSAPEPSLGLWGRCGRFRARRREEARYPGVDRSAPITAEAPLNVQQKLGPDVDRGIGQIWPALGRAGAEFGEWGPSGRNEALTPDRWLSFMVETTGPKPGGRVRPSHLARSIGLTHRERARSLTKVGSI